MTDPSCPPACDGWKAVTEWSELGSRDIDGKAGRPSERARTSQYDSAGNLHARNIYGPGPDEILMRGDSSYGWFFYHADKQGSITALVAGDGSVVEKYSYDAFGRPTVTDSWGNGHYDAQGHYASRYGNRFMFTGREWLADLQLYDYRHRLYNPDNGRFLQTDPTGFDAGDMNLFRYCGDDPVDKSDPTGLYETPLGGWDVIGSGKSASYEIDKYRNSLTAQPAGTLAFALQSQDEGDGPKGGNGAAYGHRANQHRQELKYKTLSPNKNPWEIQWALTHASKKGGWIVQHIHADFKSEGIRDYWEAWQVLPGDRHTATFPLYGLDDRFAGARGSQILGSARFYEGLRLPSSFTVDAVDAARLLRATYVNPHLSAANATAPNIRSWEAQ